MCSKCFNPYFKINTPSFCCLIFFKEYLNPQVRINKMANNEVPIHAFVFLDYITFSSNIIVELFLKAVYSTMVG